MLNIERGKMYKSDMYNIKIAKINIILSTYNHLIEILNG